MACKRSSVRPRYSPLSSQEEEIFDILTHKTVSKDFKLLTECFYNNSQFTAESMSEKRIVRRRQSILLDSFRRRQSACRGNVFDFMAKAS